MYGVSVKIKLCGVFGNVTQTLRNVTEIHYKYPSVRNKVAFESDIHQTGTRKMCREHANRQKQYAARLLSALHLYPHYRKL